MGFEPEQAEYVAQLLMRLREENDKVEAAADERVEQVQQQNDEYQRQVNECVNRIVNLKTDVAVLQQESEILRGKNHDLSEQVKNLKASKRSRREPAEKGE